MKAARRPTKIVLIPETPEEFLFFEVDRELIRKAAVPFRGQLPSTLDLERVERAISRLYKEWESQEQPTKFLAQIKKTRLTRIQKAIKGLQEGARFTIRMRQELDWLREFIREQWGCGLSISLC